MVIINPRSARSAKAAKGLGGAPGAPPTTQELLEERLYPPVRRAYDRVWADWENLDDPDDPVVVQLKRELPRELWVDIFHRIFARGYPSSMDAGAKVAAADRVLLRFGFEEDDDGVVDDQLLVFLEVDDAVFNADADTLADVLLWETVALEWLLRELDPEPSDLRAVLRRFPRR